MSDVQFDVVFRGVVAGFDIEQVQAKFAQLFSLDSAKVSRLFSAQQAKLKSNERNWWRVSLSRAWSL